MRHSRLYTALALLLSATACTRVSYQPVRADTQDVAFVEQMCSAEADAIAMGAAASYRANMFMAASAAVSRKRACMMQNGFVEVRR